MATADLGQMLDEWAVAWSSSENSDIERVLDLYIDDCVFEDVTLSAVLHGKDELRTFVTDGFAAIPDFTYQVRSRFATSQWAVIEWTMSGTHRGDFPGMPATDKPFSSVRGSTILELRSGKISREADLWNGYAFMKQVGLLPSS
ncbi:MAG TPA: ester cyclase [Asanoa sp.]|jgi:steroid delta-isomerase-like uncharacterized protein|nr:ester cyclase [Asanoa sp.]